MSIFAYIRLAIVIALCSSIGVLYFVMDHYRDKAKELQTAFDAQKVEVDKCINGAVELQKENEKAFRTIESLQKQVSDERSLCDKRVANVDEKWRVIAGARFKAKPQTGTVIDDETSRRSVDLLNRMWGVQSVGETSGLSGKTDTDTVQQGNSSESQARNEERGLMRSTKPRNTAR